MNISKRYKYKLNHDTYLFPIAKLSLLYDIKHLVDFKVVTPFALILARLE